MMAIIAYIHNNYSRKFYFFSENHTTRILSCLLHIFYSMMNVTYIGLPVGFVILVYFSPCIEPLIGSFLLPTSSPLCSSTSNLTMPQSILRLTLALTEGFVLSNTFIGGTFYNVDVLLTGIAYLVAECNIAANFENPKMSVYRKLQVLEKLLNAAVKSRILPMVSIALPGLQITSCFALIKLHDQLGFYTMPIYVSVYLDVAMFNVLVFTGAARVYILGDRLLRGWREEVKAEQNCGIREKRMMLKSFRKLRVEFGNNFVDQLTPLVLQDFCTKQSISMLVLSGSTTEVG